MDRLNAIGQDDKMLAKAARRQYAAELLEEMRPAGYLDASEVRRAIDRTGMTERISPAYVRGAELSLPAEISARCAGCTDIDRIVLAGMGGSAIGPLAAAEILRNTGRHLPVEVHRHYPLPRLRMDERVLVILSSFSGNTEESLSTYEEAVRGGAQVICVSKDGLLERCARSRGDPFARIPAEDLKLHQPRESLPLSMMIFLMLFAELPIVPFASTELDAMREGLSQMVRDQDESWGPEVPFSANPAKQIALYMLYGTTDGTGEGVAFSHPRIPLVMVSQENASVGIRIENQFGESVEHPIKVLTLFEDAHNEIEGTVTCAVEARLAGREDPFTHLAIRSPDEHPRARTRFDRTIAELFERNDVEVYSVEARGENELARKIHILQLLDYARAYACILRGTDPIPVEAMDRMKDVMHRTLTPEDRDALRFLRSREATNVHIFRRYLAERHSFPERVLYRLERRGAISIDRHGAIHIG